ncbi:MAG: hypothetical protein NVSMB5_06170 [Candidatus Velthaea sp.]
MNNDPHVLAYAENRSVARREAVLAAYHYLCLRGAKKFVRPGTDRADLVQVAAIGLIKAVDNFDAHMKTPFEAYAWILIVGELMHFVRDHERSVRIPRSLRTLERRFLLACETLTAKLQRAPSTAEIAADMAIPETLVDELRLVRTGGNIISIEEQTGSPIGEFEARTSGPSVDDRLALMSAISALGERERTIVLGTFASGLSQAALGRRLGLSQSQISKLIKKALEKIHRAVA